jgi:hypothetical protein
VQSSVVNARVLTWSGPLAAAPAGLLADLAAGLSSTGVRQASLAVLQGGAVDVVGVAAPAGEDVGHIASLLARTPVVVAGQDSEAVWDHLAVVARTAKTLMAERQIIAVALTFRGRGRLIGPLNGDLLLRFGVSMWR